MAAGGNLYANRTGVRLKKSVAALWGIVSPKGPSCFRGTLPELRGHKNVSTTMISTHALNGVGIDRWPITGYTSQSIQQVKRFT